MKRFLFLIVIIIILGCRFVNSKEKETTKIQKLQEKVVTIHNKLLEKEAKIESINLEILIGKQKQAILKKKIKDKEDIAESIIFLKKNEIESKGVKFLYPIILQKPNFVTQQIIKNETLQILKKDINMFFTNFKEYENVELNILKQKKKLYSEKQNLESFQKSLTSQIKKKNNLQKKNQKKKYSKIQKEISKKAYNINDLINETKYKKYKKVNKNKQKIRQPVNGKIIEKFGESNNYLTKNGIIFEPRINSYVISPIQGVVKYAGDFRSYGKLVIIVNEKGYHCILSGMDELMTIAGNRVLVGEPVAKNNFKTGGKNKKRVYFELRYKGKVIDPKREVEIL